MEEALKGLKGKTLTKKKIFDFLADIDIESLFVKKDDTVISKPPVIESDIVPKVVKLESSLVVKLLEVKCKACQKIFTAESSLKRHHKQNPVCINWLSHPEATETINLTKGIHLIIDDILGRSISLNGALECRFCKVCFTTKGNHHKHFNSSTVCNQLAYQEFKKLFNSL